MRSWWPCGTLCTSFSFACPHSVLGESCFLSCRWLLAAQASTSPSREEPCLARASGSRRRPPSSMGSSWSLNREADLWSGKRAMDSCATRASNSSGACARACPQALRWAAAALATRDASSSNRERGRLYPYRSSISTCSLSSGHLGATCSAAPSSAPAASSASRTAAASRCPSSASSSASAPTSCTPASAAAGAALAAAGSSSPSGRVQQGSNWKTASQHSASPVGPRRSSQQRSRE
mmetsp:Transcript_59170/g.190337  ORF Transcript_59170/g.190337 Transcript_59170/m.190337 type:complete len:237 (-) Transcript_59170:164-874(-)